jgi:hypothetical protein
VTQLTSYLFLQKMCNLALDYSRCARAVKKEWASAADCLKFLTTDHKDDMEIKMALVKKIADPATVCSLCKPPKEWLLGVRFFKRFLDIFNKKDSF